MREFLYLFKQTLKWKIKSFIICNILLLLTLVYSTFIAGEFGETLLVMFLIFLMYPLFVLGSLIVLHNNTSFSSIAFSYKYMQSLPLSKKKLLTILFLGPIHSLFPVIFAMVWGVVFWRNNTSIDVTLMKFGNFISEHYYLCIILLLISYVSLLCLHFLTLIKVGRIVGMRWSYSNLLLSLESLLYFLLWFSFGCFSLSLSFKYGAYWFLPIILIIPSTHLIFITYRNFIKERFSYWEMKRNLINIFSYFILSVIFVVISMFLVVSRKNYLENKYAEQSENTSIENNIDINKDPLSLDSSSIHLIHNVALHVHNVEKAKDYLIKNIEYLGTPAKKADEHATKTRISNGDTPFHLLAYKGETEVLSKAIENNKELIYKVNEFKQTALHYATANCSYNVAKILLENGADINAQTIKGNSPLMKASESDCVVLVAYYVNKGADLNIKNNLGETAVDIASKKGKCQNVFLLNEMRSCKGKD